MKIVETFYGSPIWPRMTTGGTYRADPAADRGTSTWRPDVRVIRWTTYRCAVCHTTRPGIGDRENAIENVCETCLQFQDRHSSETVK